MIALEVPDGAAFDFLLLFLVVVAGPALVERARVPGIIGLLIGGWLLGPHGLELIGSGNQMVPELGEFGLLYLMFVAGLELDLKVLRRHRRTAIAFGLLTFAAPFLAGLVVAAALTFSTPAALLLGSLLASHTLILHPTIRRAGLGDNPSVAAAVGGTVLTDTLALVVLAGVAGTETGTGSTGAVLGEVGLGLVVLGAASFVALPWLVEASLRVLRPEPAARFLVTAVAFLAAASLAEVFGIEGIVGAFFAGLALNPLVPNRGRTMERIDFLGSAVFVPVFLVSTGLLLDPSVMFTAETLRFAALFITACIGGKAVAALLARVLLGVPGPEAGVMFVLTTPQAAATLAATSVGYEIGLFSTAVVNAVLVLILVSIVSSTLLVPRFVRGIDAGVGAGADEGVGERVLLATWTGTPSSAAIHLAARIARRDGGIADLVMLRADPDAAADVARIGALEALAIRAGLEGEVALAVAGTHDQALGRLAAEHGATLVIADVVVEDDGGIRDVGAVASYCTAPVVVVVGSAGPVRRVVVAPLHPPGQPPAVAALVQYVAAAAAGRSGCVDTTDADGWPARLEDGDLGITAVTEPGDLLRLFPCPGRSIAAVVASAVAPQPSSTP